MRPNKLTSSKRTWKENTWPKALFLSAAVPLNSEPLKPVFSGFKSLVVMGHGEFAFSTPALEIQNKIRKNNDQGNFSEDRA